MYGFFDQFVLCVCYLLCMLIVCYIQDGELVGLQMLVCVVGLEVSLVIICNILGDLEDLGLLVLLYILVGCILIVYGYWVFVDSLLQMQLLGEGELVWLCQELVGGGSIQVLFGSVLELFLVMSYFVGVVSVSWCEQFVFCQIDFVVLDGCWVLVILVFVDNEVQNWVIEIWQEFVLGQLEQVVNYFNVYFVGLLMVEICICLLLELCDVWFELEQLFVYSIELVEQVLQLVVDDMLVVGQICLMGVQDLFDLECLCELFELFFSKCEILQLLEWIIQVLGVCIFIGEEIGMMLLQGVLLVIVLYIVNGQVLGVLGVIGFKWMVYDWVILLVQVIVDVFGVVFLLVGCMLGIFDV